MNAAEPTASWLNTTKWNISSTHSSMGGCGSGETEKQHLKEILAILVSVIMAIIMIGIGCSIEIKKVLEHLRKPTGIIIGLICQFVIMPVLAYAWARIFQMEDPETLSILIIGSCPGGTSSNIAAYWIGGDMELSSMMTTVSVTLSLGMMPLLLHVYTIVFVTSSLTVPFQSLGIALALIIVPLTAGALINYKFPSAAGKILRVSSVVGILALIIVSGISIPTFYCYWRIDVGQIVTAVCFPLSGALLGYSITSVVSVTKPLYLHHRERRTISAETGIQNTQIAIAIIQLSHWSLEITGRAVVFPILYALSQIVWCLIFIVLFRFFHCIQSHSGAFSRNKQENGTSTESGTTVIGELNPVFEVNNS